METISVDFTLPEPAGPAAGWLEGALRSLAGVELAAGPAAVLHLAAPHVETLPGPGGRAISLSVAAVQVVQAPIPSHWLPRLLVAGFEERAQPLGEVLWFRLMPARGTTRGRAACAADPPPLVELFDDLLRRMEARWPAAGPLAALSAAAQDARQDRWLQAAFGAERSGAEPCGAGRAGAEHSGRVEARAAAPGAPAAQPPRAADPPPEPDPWCAAPAPPRRRGRKPVNPAEINRLCADWLRLQDRVSQGDFCNSRGISPSRLRSWLQGYPYDESR